MSDFDPNQLPDLLPIYYKRLFPFGPFYRWLSYGNIKKEYFENREFSFTLGEDIVIRYQAFANQNEMEDDIKKRCPYKIDIGAVFSHKPKNHRLVSSMFPEEKELVFDIDMTDYDDVRQCCQGADVCNKCWRFMSIAVQVLDTALRDDFGWEHLLWVFSGRRGVHCWVCDESARRLDQMQRGAVAEYLQIVTGGEHQGKKVSLPGDRLHPSISRSVEIIEKQFKTLVEEQDFFNNEGITSLLATIKDETLHNEIKKGVENCSSSKEKFNKIENIISYHRSKGNLKWRSKHLLEEIILQYAYPRLDINVSKGLNHLLKSPFCVHPKTGKVCVPFNPRAVQNFNPSTVPTIISLIEEIQKFDEKQQEIVTADAGKTRVKDYKKTSLNKSVTIFLEFLRKLEETWKGKLIQMSDEKMEF